MVGEPDLNPDENVFDLANTSILRSDKSREVLELSSPAQITLETSWDNIPLILKAIATKLKDFPEPLPINQKTVNRYQVKRRLGFNGRKGDFITRFDNEGSLSDMAPELRANQLDKFASYMERYLHPAPEYLANPERNTHRTKYPEYLSYVDLADLLPKPAVLIRQIDTHEEVSYTIDMWNLGEATFNFIENLTAIYRPDRRTDFYKFIRNDIPPGQSIHVNIQTLPEDFPVPPIYLKQGHMDKGY